ncbi:hypothetical protein AMTRI_Chr04g248430 [Amborella trichopoda]
MKSPNKNNKKGPRLLDLIYKHRIVHHLHIHRDSEKIGLSCEKLILAPSPGLERDPPPILRNMNLVSITQYILNRRTWYSLRPTSLTAHERLHSSLQNYSQASLDIYDIFPSSFSQEGEKFLRGPVSLLKRDTQ